MIDATRCTACGDFILPNAPFLKVGDAEYHPQCFRCTRCQEPITRFAKLDNKPYCGSCYSKARQKEGGRENEEIESNRVRICACTQHADVYQVALERRSMAGAAAAQQVSCLHALNQFHTCRFNFCCCCFAHFTTWLYPLITGSSCSPSAMGTASKQIHMHTQYLLLLLFGGVLLVIAENCRSRSKTSSGAFWEARTERTARRISSATSSTFVPSKRSVLGFFFFGRSSIFSRFSKQQIFRICLPLWLPLCSPTNGWLRPAF